MKKWSTPKDWFGTPHDGMFILAVSRNRDSSILANCNFEEAVRRLKAVADECAEEGCETWYTVRESHWAYGWIEWIAINPVCTVAVAVAEQIKKELDDYPILDEMRYYEALHEAAAAYWDDPLMRKSNMNLLVAHGYSHLAVRRALWEQEDDIIEHVNNTVEGY